MNRLKTTDTGGFPLRLDDFRWLDEAEREAFLGVVKTLIGDEEQCILYGCEITIEPGTGWDCTEGFVFFNDEIYYVAAHWVDWPTDPYSLYFEEDIDHDSDGYKVFENTGTHETYEIRRAKLNTGATAPPNTMPWDTDDFITILKVRLDLYQPPPVTGWTTVALNSGNVTLLSGSLSSVSGDITYKIDGKTIFVAINLITVVSSPGGSLNITLPNGIKVDRDVHKVSIISNLVTRPPDQTVPETLYRLAAWDGETYITVAHLNAGENLVNGSYYLTGEIFFEIQ